MQFELNSNTLNSSQVSLNLIFYSIQFNLNFKIKNSIYGIEFRLN
jgi:hypothetical protein